GLPTTNDHNAMQHRHLAQLFTACSAAALSAVAADGSWTQIAWENQSFSVSGTQTVRYGTNGAWITKTVTGSGQCSNAFFGSDPAYGIGKVCQVSSAAAPAPSPAPAPAPATAQVCTPPVTAVS